MAKNEISICHIELDEDAEEIKENLIRDDKTLITAIISYCGKLDDDVEIFEQFSNLIVTEEGWYVALYSKDVKRIQNG